MTNEEIRIAVAEEMGWQDVTVGHDCVIGLPPGFTEDQCPEGADEFVPDYPNSLDACAEFRDTLHPSEVEEYAKHLWLILERDWTPKRWDSFTTLGQSYAMCDANAVQHCEALLRMRGKWKEDGK